MRFRRSGWRSLPSARVLRAVSPNSRSCGAGSKACSARRSSGSPGGGRSSGAEMASLKALKVRIGSVKSTQKITKAMKMVAAAKLRRAQQSAEAGRPYSTRMTEVVASLTAKLTPGPQTPKLLVGTGKDDTHLIIVAASDRGLAGAFNTNIVRAARRKADDLTEQGKNVLFYIVGRKGRPVLQRLYPKQIIAQFDTSEMKAPTYADAQAIAKDIIDRYTTDGIDIVHLAYAEFRSTLVQEPRVDQIIPVPPPAPAEGAKGPASLASIEYEPDEEDILNDLIPRNIAVQLYRALLE